MADTTLRPHYEITHLTSCRNEKNTTFSQIYIFIHYPLEIKTIQAQIFIRLSKISIDNTNYFA